MTLNGVMAVALRYFIEFGTSVFQHVTASICGGIHARVYCILQCVLRVRCRRYESSRSLSHLLMSFLLKKLTTEKLSQLLSKVVVVVVVVSTFIKRTISKISH